MWGGAASATTVSTLSLESLKRNRLFVVIVAVFGAAASATAQESKSLPICPESTAKSTTTVESNEEFLRRALRERLGRDVQVQMVGPQTAPKANPNAEVLKPPHCIPANEASSDGKPPLQVGRVQVTGTGANADDTKRVISQKDLADPDKPLAIQHLAMQPGLVVTNRGISMLGMAESETRVLVDGRRPPLGFSITRLSASDLERIEYVFGADAAFPGSGIGGTINFITKRNAVKPRSSISVARSGGNDTGLTLHASGAHPIGMYSSHSCNLEWLDIQSDNSGSSNDYRWSGLSRPNGTSSNDRDSISRNRVGFAGYTITHLLPGGSSLRWSLRRNQSDFENNDYFSNWRGDILGLPLIERIADRSTATNSAGMDWQKKFANGSAVNATLTRIGRTEDSDSMIIEEAALNSTRASRNSSISDGSNLLFDLGYQLPKLARVNWSVGLNYSKDKQNTSYTWFGDGGDYESHSVDQRELSAAYVKAVAPIGKRVSMNAGLRYAGAKLDGTRSILTSPRYSYNENWIEPSVTFSVNQAHNRRTTIALSRNVNVPGVHRLQVNPLPVLGYENMPLFATRVFGERGARLNKVDSIVVTSDLPDFLNFKMFASGALHHYRDTFGDRIFDVDGTWLIQPWTLENATVRGLSFTAKRGRDVGWPVAGKIDVQFSASRNWANLAGNNKANTVSGVPISNIDLRVEYRAGSAVFTASLGKRDNGRVYSGPAYWLEMNNPVSARVATTWRFNPRWTASLGMSNLIAGDSVTAFAFNDGKHSMTSVRTGKTRPQFQVTVARSVNPR